MSIGTLIKTIQDIMRKDVGVDGDAQRISQIVWLLFLKIFDDKEQEWQLTIPGYKSPLQTRFRWSNWAKDAEGITGEELIDFVNNELFPSLKKLATSAGVTPHGKVVGSVFEDAYNYMKSGTLLRQVINTIEDDVDFNSSTDRHLFNDIYEKILADLQSAGNAGEYYTPRAVTQFMVDILDPQLGESVLDPACGTGGFLTVRGEKSKIVQQHARKIVTEMQKREKIAKGKGKDVDLNIEELEDLSVDRAVVRIISWRGISEDGEDIPFTKENAARILKEHSWIKEAVFENSDELLNFRN